MIYGRSKEVPTLGLWNEEKMLKLLDHPCFFWDALYVHMKPGEGGSVVQEVYDFLTKVDGCQARRIIVVFLRHCLYFTD